MQILLNKIFKLIASIYTRYHLEAVQCNNLRRRKKKLISEIIEIKLMKLHYIYLQFPYIVIQN